MKRVIKYGSLMTLADDGDGHQWQGGRGASAAPLSAGPPDGTMAESLATEISRHRSTTSNSGAGRLLSRSRLRRCVTTSHGLLRVSGSGRCRAWKSSGGMRALRYSYN